MQSNKRFKKENSCDVQNDFFSELLMDFLQYDLFDPYLHYRLPELILVSKSFSRCGKDTKQNDCRVDLHSNESRIDIDLFERFIDVAPIFDEIFEMLIKEQLSDRPYIVENNNTLNIKNLLDYRSKFKCSHHKCLCSIDTCNCDRKKSKQSFCEGCMKKYSYFCHSLNDIKFTDPLDKVFKNKMDVDSWLYILCRVRCPYLLFAYVSKNIAVEYYEILRASTIIGDVEVFGIFSSINMYFTGWEKNDPFGEFLSQAIKEEDRSRNQFLFHDRKNFKNLLLKFYRVWKKGILNQHKRKYQPYTKEDELINFYFSIYFDDLDNFIKFNSFMKNNNKDPLNYISLLRSWRPKQIDNYLKKSFF